VIFVGADPRRSLLFAPEQAKTSAKLAEREVETMLSAAKILDLTSNLSHE
jgi:hypothetical protein